ncbi:hypothetical protein JCM10450v2_005006 [Rhodotorula kratochvilovae]
MTAAQRMQAAHEAAQQQQQHAPLLEDPFPVAALPPPVAPNGPPKAAKQARQVDVSDESAFPSLGAPLAASSAPKSLWGAGGGAALRAKQASTAAAAQGAAGSQSTSRASTPAPAGGDTASTTFSLPTASIHISAPSGPRGPRGFSNERRDAPTTLGEVLKEVMRRNDGVTVEASSSSKTATFIVKARGARADERAERAKAELIGWLEKKVEEKVLVPKDLRAVIIGAKGRTLKGIIDSTGASIQFPREDELAAAEVAPPADDPDAGPQIPATLSGAETAVAAAKAQILAIVRERTSKTTLRVPDVPAELWALLGARVPALLERAGAQPGAESEVRVEVPRRSVSRRGVDVLKEGGDDALSAQAQAEQDKRDAEKAVTVSGDKDAVKRVIEQIEAEVADLRSTVRMVTFQLPKRQHRFLVGSAVADGLLAETGCAVEVPSAESSSEDVVVRGPGRETVKAMQLVMDVASATPVEALDLFTAHRGAHDPRAYAAHLARYLAVKTRLRPVAQQTRTQIFLPRPEGIPNAQNAWLEIVGSSEGDGAEQGIAQARAAVIAEVRRLPPAAFDVAEVDPLVHRHLVGKKGARVKQLEKDHSVDVVFPPADADRSDVLLVFTGENPSGPEARAALDAVKEAIGALAGEYADLTSETLVIPTALHPAVQGQGGTTLNAVIGEDKLVHVAFGAGAGREDEVVVRGPKDEVARVKGELERIAEEAKNEEIVNSHVIEFDIPTEHVRHIVGKAGAGVNKLREDLGVRVDFGEQGAGGKKGPTSKVTLKGRKENVEEAKRRIQSLATRMADEVTLAIPLAASLDRGSLIGKQGAFLKRLEDRYDVRINFPRGGAGKGANGDSAPATPQEITIRGPSKGAKAAQGELVALIEYEKEHGNVVSFSVAVKALPRILGRGGSQVNQIKDDTGVASLDVDQENSEATTATITLRGTKSAIKKAREAVEKIAQEVQDELRVELDIPREYHTTLIGSGGSSIRELIARCGGPTDARASGNTVRFPRQGDGKDIVVITAPSAVASKIRDALEHEVALLKSRVVWGVVVSHQAHAAVIGKGAQALQDLQRKHGVKVVMPGWNDYASAGEPENQADLVDADARDLVKVIGPKDAALAAATDLQAVKPRGGAGGAGSGASTPGAHAVEIAVPKKLHAQVAQGGRFFRSLPSGTRVSHRGVKPPSSALKSKKPPVSSAAASSNGAARIDDDVDGANGATEPEALEFQLVPLHEGGDANGVDGADDEIPWVVESRTQEDAESVAAEIRRNLAKAQESSHVGWVTVPRGLMPRIVGRGGAGLDRLRAAGVDVEVVGKRDANQLTLTGSPSNIDSAYEIIRELNAPRPPRRQRQEYEDDY